MKGFEVTISDYGNVLTFKVETNTPDRVLEASIVASDMAAQVVQVLELATRWIKEEHLTIKNVVELSDISLVQASFVGR